MAELSQRLEKLLLDMDQLYAKLLGRLSLRDQEEARTMFQLVCFEAAESYHLGVSLRQLKRAVATLQNGISGLARNSMDQLERFRNRLRELRAGVFWKKPSIKKPLLLMTLLIEPRSVPKGMVE